MAKPKVSLQGAIAPVAPPAHVSARSPGSAPAQLRDADVPQAPGPISPAPAPASGDRPAQAHRSLYARPETLDLIREIAFKDRVSAQSLYREGLLLMLQKRGYFRDKSIDDV